MFGLKWNDYFVPVLCYVEKPLFFAYSPTEQKSLKKYFVTKMCTPRDLTMHKQLSFETSPSGSILPEMSPRKYRQSNRGIDASIDTILFRTHNKWLLSTDFLRKNTSRNISKVPMTAHRNENLFYSNGAQSCPQYLKDDKIRAKEARGGEGATVSPTSVHDNGTYVRARAEKKVCTAKDQWNEPWLLYK